MEALAFELTKPKTTLLRGTVLEAGPPLRVELDDGREIRAEQLAGVAPHPGDRLLLAAETEEAFVAIGALTTSHLHAVADSSPRSCQTCDGARAELEGDDDQRLVVRDGDGRLLFEYDATRKASIVHAPAGDLELRADEGAITLNAAQGIALRGGPAVEVDADALRASVDEAELTTAEAALTADVLRTVCRRARHQVDVLETRAGRIIERAKESYRDIETLAQTRAGRLRLVAEKTVHLMGRRTLFKAHEDVKIKGDKIHLG